MNQPVTDKNCFGIANKISSLFSNYNVFDVDHYFYLFARAKEHLTFSYLCITRWRRISFGDRRCISFFFTDYRQNWRKRDSFQTLGCQTSERSRVPSYTLDSNRYFSIPLWPSHFSPIKKAVFSFNSLSDFCVHFARADYYIKGTLTSIFYLMEN